MNRGRVRGYFPELAKSIFILDILEQEEEAKREFVAEVLELNLIGGSWHLGGYLGPQEELEAWVKSPSGGMGPQGKSLSYNSQATPTVGICWLKDFFATQVAVTTKDCTWSSHSGGYH